ncbi:DUF4241 domain-containing protein [Couchioplanes azureus]|uniref:DUF4241 domain-containing protein n=1 Tax=Couchioplanes caeruleus TaxID=56438 RepID=UPI00167137FE|nr:DUF4241 domain-containing protein [Couchioplanes caeruleus]GGQ54301.1 hypothetical protein GCM10010166_24040 [Couchioplanes caeruleus subsp. azureus]
MAVDIGEMLDRLLVEDARYVDDTHDYRLTMVPLGEVTLPSGRVVACDPLVHPGETPPFTVTVPPGRYPLRAWVAVVHPAAGDRPGGRRLADQRVLASGPPPGGPLTRDRASPARDHAASTRDRATPGRDRPESDRRTAALQLVIREEPVVAWEPAVVPGADPGLLDEDGFWAYPVDSGVGTLADECALAALETWAYARVERVFLPEPPPPAPGALRAIADPATGADVVAVSTGWGEDAYATFVGRTASGEVASFVTDFRVV